MKIKTLVLSGGGIKGICIASSLELLYEKNKLKYLNKIIGTSVGALIAVLMAVNFTPKQIKLLLKNINLSKYQKFDFNLLLTDYGFDNGDELLKLFETILKNKNINNQITFKELDQISKYKITLVGTNLNDRKPTYFNVENYPDLPVITAVRISSSYPIAFTPIQLNDNLYSDGAIVSPLATELLEKKEIKYTLGIAVHRGSKKDLSSLNGYFSGILNSIIDSLTDWNIKKLKHCIILSSKIDAIEFELSDEEKLELENLGIVKTQEWLDSI